MDKFTKDDVNGKNPKHLGKSSHVREAAIELLNEGKKLSNEIYEESLHRIANAENNLKGQSEVLLNKVKENPLASILIAGGVGFILSALLKK